MKHEEWKVTDNRIGAGSGDKRPNNDEKVTTCKEITSKEGWQGFEQDHGT